MSKIQVYIAASLDGYIARKDGSIDWLENIENPENTDHGYGAFYSQVSMVVMGRKSYEKIQSFDVEWPYQDVKTYILSKKADLEIFSPNTVVIDKLNPSTIDALRSESKKNIWIVGGGEVISEFLSLSAIDEIILAVFPIILGEGIPLFRKGIPEKNLNLQKAEPFDTGLTLLYYEVKKSGN